MRQQLAKWNPARSAWETDEQSVCGHSVVYSETFPSSGMTRHGRAYALPMWEPPTGGSASSSSRGRLMPTPTTDDAGNLTRDSGEFQSLTRTVAHL